MYLTRSSPGEQARARTVLVVDDSESIRLVTRRMLECLGCKVIVARDGFEAVDIFESFKNAIDLVIVDLTMPGMDGIELVDKLFLLDPGARIVISTARDRDLVPPEVARRATGFLGKPFTLADLERCIDSWPASI